MEYRHDHPDLERLCDTDEDTHKMAPPMCPTCGHCEAANPSNTTLICNHCDLPRRADGYSNSSSMGGHSRYCRCHQDLDGVAHPTRKAAHAANYAIKEVSLLSKDGIVTDVVWDTVTFSDLEDLD